MTFKISDASAVWSRVTGTDVISCHPRSSSDRPGRQGRALSAGPSVLFRQWANLRGGGQTSRLFSLFTLSAFQALSAPGGQESIVLPQMNTVKNYTRSMYVSQETRIIRTVQIKVINERLHV